MTTSLGEAPLVSDSFVLGTFRALQLSAVSACSPRLALTVGVTLIGPLDQPDHSLVMRGLVGELRLAPDTKAIATFHWVGPRRGMRSSLQPFEQQVRLAADVSERGLANVESQRSGGPLRLWLELWPTLTCGGEPKDAAAAVLPLAVPRDDWIAVLEGVGFGKVEVLEIPCEGWSGAGAAAAQLRRADGLIGRGQYQEAIAACRTALEAAGFVKEPEATARQALVVMSGERRGGEYLRIIAGLKQVGGNAVHSYGASSLFVRDEALFVFRATASIVALLAAARVRAADAEATSAE